MTSSPAAAAPVKSELERRTVRKLMLRFMPILMATYFMAYLDRTNLGIIKPHISKDLGLSPVAFGLASGIFFLGYVLCEVPSNHFMLKWGARLWIPRILITWGAVAALIAFVQNPAQLYVGRVLLGIAEAGLAPAIFLIIATWFPARYSRLLMSVFFLTIPLALMVGSPLSGWLLDLTQGWHGWDGWRWVVLLQGLATIALFPLAFKLLPRSPQTASFLNEEERAWLLTQLDGEADVKKEHAPGSFLRALIDRRVLVMSLTYVLICYGSNALTYWLPSIIEEATPGLSSLHVGLITAIPFACAFVAIILVGQIAARTNARLWNILGPLSVAIVAFVLTAIAVHDSRLALGAMSLAIAGSLATQPQFWTLPADYLTGASAAAGIALINSAGNLAGFLGPFSFGWMQGSAGKTTALPFLIMAVCMAIAGVLVFLVRRRVRNMAAVHVGDDQPATTTPASTTASSTAEAVWPATAPTDRPRPPHAARRRNCHDRTQPADCCPSPGPWRRHRLRGPGPAGGDHRADRADRPRFPSRRSSADRRCGSRGQPHAARSPGAGAAR